MIFKKITNFGLIIGIIALSITNSFSQNTIRISYDVDPLYDMPGGILESTTGNYVFGGGLLIGGITEIDPTGLVNWSEGFSEATTIFSDIVNVGTGYLVAGSSSNRLLLMETSSTGTMVWGKKYNTSADSESAAQVKRLGNGDYIIAGSVTGYDPDGAGPLPKHDSATLYIVKTNSIGTVLWDKIILPTAFDNDHYFTDVAEVSGGYVFVGSVSEGIANDNIDAIIMKTDVNGNILWTRTLGSGGVDDAFESINPLASGELLISGFIDEDLLMLRVDANGNDTWSSTYDDPDLVKIDVTQGFNAFETNDGYYACVGTYIDVITFVNGVNGNFPMIGTFLIKVNPSDESVVFQKFYQNGLSSLMPDGIQTSDNGYLITMMAQEIAPLSGFNYHVIKTDPNGDVGTNCDLATINLTNSGFSSSFTTITPSAYSGTTESVFTPILNTPTPAVGAICCSVDNPTTASASPSTVCAGQPITISASGSAPGVTYNIYDAATGGTQVGTAGTPFVPTQGTYYVEAASSLGCTSVSRIAVTVTIVPIPTVTGSASPATICTGETSTLTASGATTYTWSPATGLSATTGTNVTFTGSASTTYTITGTTSGCSSTGTVAVTVNAPPVAVITGPATACDNEMITLDASTSTASTYTWSNGATTPSITVLANTGYSVTVGIAGCTVTDAATHPITVNTSPAASISGTDVCSGSAVTLTATGGSSYVWLAGGSTGSTLSVSPTTATTYDVEATAANGCKDTAQFTVNVNALPTVVANTTNATVCTGDQITLTGSGAVSYTWNNGVTDNSAFTPTSTTYTVTGTDANGCQNTDAVAITVNALPTITVTGTTTICNGSNSTLTASGASTYTWSPATGLSATTGAVVTASPTSAITYTVAGIDANGCANSTTIPMLVNALPTVVANASPNSIVCAGDQITLSGSGANTYTWDNGVTDNTAFTPTSITYTVTGTDANGCQNTDAIAITVNALPTINVAGTSTICEGDNSVLTASGANTYSWSPATGLSATTGAVVTASPTANITYTVTGTDANSCVNSTTVAVSVNALPTVSANVSPSSTVCTGSSVTLTGSGASTYSWDNLVVDGVAFTPAVGSVLYTVTGTDGNNCSNTDTITVNVVAPPVANINGSANGTVTACSNETTTLTITPAGGTYLWSTGATTQSIDVMPNTTTVYNATVTIGSCSDATNYTVTVNTAPTGAVSGTGNNLVCTGTNDTLTASGGSTYLWNTTETTPSIVVTPTAATTYTVVVYDANLCTDTLTYNVSVNPLPTISITGIDTICSGTSTTLSGNGGISYIWSTAETTQSISVSPTLNATYSVTGTDANGCQNTDQVSIVVMAPPSAGVTGDTVTCTGQAVVLTAAGGNNYVWSTGESTGQVSVSPGTTTTYTVVAYVGSCADTATYTVNVTLPPNVTIGADTSIIIGQSFTLNATGADQYSWITPNDGIDASELNTSNPTASPQETITYCVVGEQFGCLDTACINVEVRIDCGDIFVPNAFSPNGDNNNDCLKVYSNCLETMVFRIYARWGEMVFETTDIDGCWDGTYKGQALNTATFAFVLEYTLIDGTSDVLKGNVSLIK